MSRNLLSGIMRLPAFKTFLTAPKGTFRPPLLKPSGFPQQQVNFSTWGKKTPKIDLTKEPLTQVKPEQLKPMQGSPLWAAVKLAAVGARWFLQDVEHPEGRVQALEFLEREFKSKPGTVGDVVRGGLKSFIDSLRPELRNSLSGNIAAHYEKEAITLLQRKATPFSLAATALFETNHWQHTAHEGSRKLGSAMSAEQRHIVLVNTMKAEAKGETLDSLSLMTDTRTPEEKAAFKTMESAWNALCVDHCDATGKFDIKDGLPAFVQALDQAEKAES